MKSVYRLLSFALAALAAVPCFPKGKPSAPRMDRSRLNVGAYYLQPYARTEAHVRDVAACGIDFILNFSYDKATLDLLQKYHVGAVVTGILPGWWGGDGNKAGKLGENNPPEKYAAAARGFADHPAIWGIDIGDEPSALDFPYYNKVWQQVGSLFPNQFPYLNLYPNYASVSQNSVSQTESQLGTASYDEYIREYCENVTASDYICYDFYLYSINVPRAYSNLITVSQAALQYGKDMWIVLQVNSNDKDKWISENELRFQAYTAMAFGARNIIWACYTAGWWHNQVLDDKGRKTQQYDKLRRVNAEIHHLGEPYMRYKRVATRFVGFDGSKWLDGVAAASASRYADGQVSGLQSADGSPIVVGKMVSRNDWKREALFVCTADDPYDSSPKTHTITFNTAKRVRVTTTDSQYKLKKSPDGNYSIKMDSNRGMLVELL